MGDDLFLGSCHLYYGVGNVFKNTELLSFDYDIPRPVELFPSEVKSYELSFDLSLNDENNPLGKCKMKVKKRKVYESKN